jgi:hypothetical protein
MLCQCSAHCIVKTSSGARLARFVSAMVSWCLEVFPRIVIPVGLFSARARRSPSCRSARTGVLGIGAEANQRRSAGKVAAPGGCDRAGRGLIDEGSGVDLAGRGGLKRGLAWTSVFRYGGAT